MLLHTTGGLDLGEGSRLSAAALEAAPDGESVLDRLGPIVVGSPCSGHGFKFAPLVGKLLADLATGTPIELRLEAFRAGRTWARRAIADRAFDA